MYELVNSQEMKLYDKNTIETFGVPSAVLMERASLAIADAVAGRFRRKNTKILIICGSGNNGGDGFAAGRILFLRGYSVEFLAPMQKDRMTEETALQRRIVEAYHIPVFSQLQGSSYDVIIDALFGIGLSRPLEGALGSLVHTLNELKAYKIAADIASGIFADTGEAPATAFYADLTVTFGFAQVGHLLYPGAEHTGELIVADIGIGRQSFLGKKPMGRYVSRECVKELLPMRKAYSNKGTYGRVLIIAGSKQMAGAAYFAAKAAYAAGCGLVRVLTAKENRNVLSAQLPEAIVNVYQTEREAADALETYLPWADAVLIGCGLSTDTVARSLVSGLLSHSEKKVVLDADALNLLSEDMRLLESFHGTCIVTPHLKEMSRLVHKTVEEVSKDLPKSAQSFAQRYQAVCALKDARTVIGLPEGGFIVNVTGNHGMATGGSGDALAGYLAGFLAQNMPAGQAAALGVCLHGMAGDLAAEEKGAFGMTASDILNQLPYAAKRASETEQSSD